MPQTSAPDAALLSENARLKQRLNGLLEEARRNEATMRRFQSVELRLLGCHSLSELLKMLIQHGRETFGWDSVSILLSDPEYEIGRLTHPVQSNSDLDGHLILIHTPDSPDTDRPAFLGSFHPHEHRHLFRREDLPVSSVAILPLVRVGRRIGSLNLGSLDPDRFQADAATDFLEHLAGVISVCIETTVTQERLKYLGLTDALTGVNNRRYFDQRLVEEIARSLRSGQRLSCIFVDIDHFKQVNDTHGHPVGDKVLQGVAQRIREQMRSADVVARFGGEEFALLLVQTGQELALDVAERIREEVAQRPIPAHSGLSVPITLSLGVSTLIPGRDQGDLQALSERLIGAADRALYAAKNGGRNQVRSETAVHS